MLFLIVKHAKAQNIVQKYNFFSKKVRIYKKMCIFAFAKCKNYLGVDWI